VEKPEHKGAAPTHGETAGFEANAEVCMALEELFTVRRVASHYPEAPEADLRSNTLDHKDPGEDAAHLDNVTSEHLQL